MTRAGLPLLLAVAWLVAAPASAQDSTAPTAVLDVPKTVAYGAALQLSGARSSDVGGRVLRYVWTRVEGTGGDMTLNLPFGTLVNSYVVPQAAGNPLAPGRHRFQLYVEDDSGNRSAAVEAQVLVVDQTAPTAVLEAPRSVTQIQPFQLSAARSFDIGGRVVRFQWTRIDGGREGPMPLGQPVVTEASSLAVAQSLTSYLAVGRHTFRLVVMDDSGNQSKANDFAVDIVAPLPTGRSQ